MQEYKVERHASSFLPDGEWKMVWNDEFDADQLDRSKWDFRYSMMGKRAKHFVGEEGISFENSDLVFHLIEKDGVYCTTQLQTGYNFMDNAGEEYDPTSAEMHTHSEAGQNYFTWPIGKIREPKFMHKYGYYECRCRMQQKEGWWSAFWLQSPVIGSTLDPQISGVEIDIMEQFWRTKFEPHNSITHNNHWNGYGSQHETTGAYTVKLQPTVDGYHRFGVEWTPEYYRYFVDGVMTWEVRAPYPVSQREQFILLTTEAVGYRCATWHQWDDLRDAVGDTWRVDYVRVFDRQ